jgi:hypothetical protein
VVAGELTRWYVLNAGPRGDVAFNFAGGVIKKNNMIIIVIILVTITVLTQNRIMWFPFHPGQEMR